MSGFDVNRMFISSQEEIERFAQSHQEETFYAFSIDAGMLCLNSIEAFKETLEYYQAKYPESYSNTEETNDLKYNTGDWKYQGFFDLDDGYNHELYSDHYNIPFENPSLDENQLAKLLQETPYHKAMYELTNKLIESNVFNKLKTSSDFKIFLSDHNY